MNRQLKSKKGFTLIELIVVIVILGILAAVAIPRLTGFQQRAKVSSDKATLSAINSAVAIGVTNGDIPDGSVTVQAAANTGVLTYTLPSGSKIDNDKFMETGSAMKLEANMGKTYTWTITDGVIASSPTIDEQTGIVTP